MPRYATIADLNQRVPWSELAEVAAQDEPAVDGELLKKAAGGATLSTESAAVRTAVQAAIARLENALDDASNVIDGYIVGRYGTLSPAPDVLNTRCVDIAVFRLLGGGEETKRYQANKNAMAWLMSVAEGKVDLVSDDQADAVGGEVRISAGERTFSDNSLDEFTHGYYA